MNNDTDFGYFYPADLTTEADFRRACEALLDNWRDLDGGRPVGAALWALTHTFDLANFGLPMAIHQVADGIDVLGLGSEFPWASVALQHGTPPDLDEDGGYFLGGVDGLADEFLTGRIPRPF